MCRVRENIKGKVQETLKGTKLQVPSARVGFSPVDSSNLRPHVSGAGGADGVQLQLPHQCWGASIDVSGQTMVLPGRTLEGDIRWWKSGGEPELWITP